MNQPTSFPGNHLQSLLNLRPIGPPPPPPPPPTHGSTSSWSADVRFAGKFGECIPPCGFCKENEPRNRPMFMSHPLRDPLGRTVCPAASFHMSHLRRHWRPRSHKVLLFKDLSRKKNSRLQKVLKYFLENKISSQTERPHKVSKDFENNFSSLEIFFLNRSYCPVTNQGRRGRSVTSALKNTIRFLILNFQIQELLILDLCNIVWDQKYNFLCQDE